LTSQVLVSLRVKTSPARAFQIFTHDIGIWWAPNTLFRFTPRSPGELAFDREGGRFIETLPDGTVFEIGRIRIWRPGERLVFGWRQSTFGPRQDTEVEITFEAVGTDTRVTVIHRGWDSIPPEHAARHCFPDAIFLRRHGEWWQLLLGRLRAQCLPSPRDTPTARSLSGSRSYTSARRTHRVPSRQSRRPWCGVPRGLIHRTKPASSSLSLPYCGDAGVSNAPMALVFSMATHAPAAGPLNSVNRRRAP
jgi:uncharacterized protein YndB with AHSA1/START domain